VVRILSAAALLAVVAAGCGGAARPQKLAVRGVPRSLAHDWEHQASAIATAAAAGNSCKALQLANALRGDVTATEQKLPRRLRTPLLTGVTTLADRITCTPPPTTVPPKRSKPPPERHGRHEQHGHHGRHGHGQDNGGGNDQ
jgi:hypothetical protein